MTKAEIVNEVAKATGIEKTQVQTVVEAFMETVKDSIVKGNPVYLRGFGSFAQHHQEIHDGDPGPRYPGFQAREGFRRSCERKINL